MEGKYCYSWNEENYYGCFDTEQEAIDDALEDNPDAEYVFIGTCTEPKLSWFSSEEEIIDSIYENLCDEVGEYAESFEVSKEDELILANMIDDAVEKWIKECGIKPNCYSVLDGHEVNLTVDK